MTPFFGGLLADRFLGPRIAVIIGGLLMSAGHLVMTQENTTLFYLALALLIAGNGLFKPNISAMVGQLYVPTARSGTAASLSFTWVSISGLRSAL